MLLQSGSSVSEWMLKLPKPSKLNKRRMGRVKRGNEVDTSGRIGRADAIKKRCLPILVTYRPNLTVLLFQRHDLRI